MLPTVSAILSTWHRPENARKIVKHLESFPFVGEILVWRDDPSVTLRVSTPKARIIDSPEGRAECGR
jgi:hypothetical protein